MITTQVLLTLFLLPAFFAMAYQEDVVGLARASHVALEPIVVESLAFIRYIVMEFRDWLEDGYADRSAQLDYLDNLDAREDSTESEEDFPNSMCLSCGIRQGVSWLGDAECYDCFSEHQWCT